MKSRGCLRTLWGLPPEMVKSSPPMATGRPSSSARPMTYAPGVKPTRLPASSYSAAPTMGPASTKLPGSTIFSMRSRTV